MSSFCVGGRYIGNTNSHYSSNLILILLYFDCPHTEQWMRVRGGWDVAAKYILPNRYPRLSGTKDVPSSGWVLVRKVGKGGF